jgi:glycosyltransferase involved in cell wall biosynthesis
LAIVSTRAVGVVDCLRHGENALLVAPGNIAELKNALREILFDEEFAPRAGAKRFGRMSPRLFVGKNRAANRRHLRAREKSSAEKRLAIYDRD